MSNASTPQASPAQPAARMTHVANVMLSRQDGGLERMALHQARGLELSGLRVTTLLHPEAKVWSLARQMGLTVAPMKLTSRLNPLGPWLLRRRVQKLGADAVLTHGNRATGIASRALGDRLPVVAVAHSTWLRLWETTAGVICLSAASLERWQERAPIAAAAPNFLTGRPTLPPHPRSTPPVIGAMARFVEKKGMTDLLAALALVRDRGLDFRAIIGGSGKEAELLEAERRRLKLEDRVELPGWISDSRRLLQEIDLFVLPSREEPFGIVALEAWAAGLPVIATDCEGPASYIEDERNGLLVARQDPEALAEAIARLLQDPLLARELAEAGQRSYLARFAESGGVTLRQALESVVAHYHAQRAQA